MKSSKHYVTILFAIACSITFLSQSFAKKKAKKKKLYKINVKKLALKKGQKGEAAFDIVLGKGAKIHPQAPFGCKVSATKTLKLAKIKIGRKDAVPYRPKHIKPTQKVFKAKKVKVPVKVVALGKGKAKVDMDCAFFVCTKDICARKVEKIAIPTNVN